MQIFKKWLGLAFDKWWWTLLFYSAATITVLFFSMGYQSKHIIAASNYLAYTAVAVLFVSMVWQFVQSRIWIGLLHVVFFVGSFGALLLVGLYNMFAPDGYADDLKIPSGIVLSEPVAENYPDTISYTYTGTTTDLLLYDDMQPGIYTYQFCTPHCEEGEIYLKAYEITRGDFLSPSMATKTLCPVKSADTMSCFRPSRDFTIYEGDWGKYYAARFEVWFRGVNQTEDRKLFEKNFKIQGWMH